MENLSLKFYESLKEAILEAEKEGVLTVNKVLKDSITVNYLIDLPQYPICDIKSVEQVKFVFSPSCSVPIPYFMRLDFPNLPHLLIGTCNEKAPCLVQSDFEHFALSWNADFYVKRVYEWLFHSSRGTLHKNDQPLEVFMLMNKGNLFIQVEALFLEEEQLYLHEKDLNYSKSFFLKNQGEPSQEVVLVKYNELSSSHKGLQGVPSNLKELNDLMHDFCVETLLSDLKKYLIPINFNRKLLFIFQVKVKDENLDKVDTQYYAFLFEDRIENLATSLGLFEAYEANLVPILGKEIGINDDLESIKIQSLGVNFHFNQKIGRISNGKMLVNNIFPSVIQIGLGAIGFGIAEGLTRTGFCGKLFLVDHDIFLPHNTSRWLLSECYGEPKVQIIANRLNDVNLTAMGTGRVEKYCSPIIEKIPFGYLSSEILEVINDSQIIIDTSASSVVQKTLDFKIKSERQRFSFFCSPNGKNLIGFYTKIGSENTHTMLELSLFKRLIHDKNMENIFHTEEKGFTYGGESCRSISHALSTHDLSIESSIGANAVESISNSKNDFLGVWRKSGFSNFNLEIIEIEKFKKVDGYGNGEKLDIYISTDLINHLNENRLENLPNETGSTLIGHYDIISNSLFVVDCLPTPTDSESSNLSFQRGVEGVKKELDRISSITHGNLYYVGEWHSHPNGIPSNPSNDDLQLLSWLREESKLLHFPYLMMIISDQDFKIFA